MRTYDVVELTLASAVANAGTFTVGYPTSRDSGDYEGGHDHKVISHEYGDLLATAGDVSFSFDASVVTITNSTGQSLAQGTKLWVQLDRLGKNDMNALLADDTKMTPAGVMVINLGAPDTADVDGVCTTELLGAAGDIPIDGAAASGGVATLDVPRNITLTTATTNHSALTITVTGTDAYGNTMSEAITGPNNNTVAGKKAFKTVTQVASDGAIATNGISVGFGDVLGLPVFLPDTGLVLAELEDGAAAAAGTVVAGVTTAATTTTGDVRGTYDPNSAADGAKAFQLIAAIPDPSFKGVTQA